MPSYRPVPLPVCDPGFPDQSAIRDRIEQWVHSAPLTDLVHHFGGRTPTGDLTRALEYLDEFSEKVWDFRRGRERYQAERREFPPDTDELVRRAAHALGLAAHERPPEASYQHLIVLGGRVRTCLARAELAARLLDSDVTANQVAGLASLRPCDPEEAEHAVRLGWSCETEFDGMTEALRTAFDITDAGVRRANPTPTPGTDWRIVTYQRAALTVHVVAAPSSAPQARRANTADTLTFWADTVAAVADRDRVLLVTSALHVPFQHCDAIRVLGLRYGCGIDTVGVPSRGTDPTRSAAPSTTALLQEIRSAIRSMRHLRASLRVCSPH